jgi:hypothetical protein
VVLGFEHRVLHLPGRCSITWVTCQPGFFCVGYFRDRVSWTIYLGWLWTVILLVSASQVARSYWLWLSWTFNMWDSPKNFPLSFFYFQSVTFHCSVLLLLEDILAKQLPGNLIPCQLCLFSVLKPLPTLLHVIKGPYPCPISCRVVTAHQSTFSLVLWLH